jgi:adenosylcobalamin-dependent ribonucleoside-triphosphate reductase
MIEYITDKDLERYQDLIIPFGPIGCLVDTRTYRRHLPTENRRETALERDKRVINYLLSLPGDRLSEEEKREEALLMLDRFLNLKAWPSSRNKWIGGTSISDIDGTASFNCSFLIVNRVGAFSTAANLLMLGSGVGYRIFQSDIDGLPDLVSRPELVIDPINQSGAEVRDEYTYSYMRDGVLHIFVGDSREGWCEAIRLFIEAYTKECTRVVLNVDSIRPEGERLKRFGGTSSGAQALIAMLRDIERTLGEREGNRILSIDANDLMCSIAKGVIAGSVRRSSLIALFDEGDESMRRCKENLYTDPSLSHKIYRSQANNTECIGSLKQEAFTEWLLMADPSQEEVDLWIKSSCPSKESLIARMESIKNSGEPGMNNYLQMIWKRYQGAKKSRVGDLRSYISGVGTNP